MKIRLLKKREKYLVVRGYFPFTLYYCKEYKGWVRRTHFLYKKCLMDYKEALTMLNYVKICNGE